MWSFSVKISIWQTFNPCFYFSVPVFIITYKFFITAIWSWVCICHISLEQRSCGGWFIYLWLGVWIALAFPQTFKIFLSTRQCPLEISLEGCDIFRFISIFVNDLDALVYLTHLVMEIYFRSHSQPAITTYKPDDNKDIWRHKQEKLTLGYIQKNARPSNISTYFSLLSVGWGTPCSF